MTENEKRMEAAGWKKCYWLGIGNLQTEYDYEPSEELVADMEECGEQPFQLNEEAIEFFILDEVHDYDEIEYFVKNAETYAWNWLMATMRMEPLDNDFIQRAAKAMAKGFTEYLSTYRSEYHLDEWERNNLLVELKEMLEEMKNV